MAETPAVVETLDTIGASAGNIPAGTKRVLAYITGGGAIEWSNAQIAELAHKGVQLVFRIDQSNNVNALTSVRVLIKDVEPGASTNLTADHEAVQRARHSLTTTLYTFLDNLDPLRASVAAVGIQAHVNYFVADWNLDRAGAVEYLAQHPDVVGVQYASPTQDPHLLVPGSKRTLSEANIDLSVTRADWPAPVPAPKKKVVHLPKVPKKAKPIPKITAAGIAGVASTAILAYLNSHGAHVTHLTTAETGLIATGAAILAGYFKKSGLPVA